MFAIVDTLDAGTSGQIVISTHRSQLDALLQLRHIRANYPALRPILLRLRPHVDAPLGQRLPDGCASEQIAVLDEYMGARPARAMQIAS